MKTQDLLLEIGTEDIPSGYFNHILDLLSCGEEGSIRGLFAAQNINLHKVFSYSTPRRIILYIKDIPAAQDISVLGPPLRIAYDQQNRSTKVLTAFLKKNSASIKDVVVDESGQEPRVMLKKKDVPNAQILAGILPDVIRFLDFPKTMRWDTCGFAFARPIRWLLAIFGEKVISFEFAGLRSSSITYGHRFLGHKKIKVKNAEAYFKLLGKNYVVWDNEARKAKILSYLEKKRWHENKQLLNEVNNLVEFPVFIEGEFREEYLKIPGEVLLASMSKHQRIFCLEDKKGGLVNRFVGVINGNYGNRKQIIRNFENVLDARLKDALFFYEADTKKPIEQWSEGLKGVVFHKKLGTVAEKVERLKKIGQFLLKATRINGCDKNYLSRAISLCKADLLTQMVGEFPSLQGVIGRYYALHSNEPEPVADAIGEHYFPRFADDDLPATSLGVLCSLADKIDNIVCYFKIGKFPKGGWDLYALRRQAIAVISILVKKKLTFSLSDTFDFVYPICPGDFNKEKLKNIFLGFFKDRFIYFSKVRFGYRHDIIEAVVACGIDDLYNSFLKLESLNSIIDEHYFEKSRSVVERTYNIIKASKDSVDDVLPALFEQPEEQALYREFKRLKPIFKQYCADREYVKATQLFGESLSGMVHDFFDKVMVNVDNKSLRINRLGLLSRINRLYRDNIADLSKIVNENKTEREG
jgi:glycyl-tRNA synthetase beta chain